MTRRDAPAAVRWTAYVGVAVAFAIACAFLSNWQFGRNAERSHQLAVVAANYDSAPVPLDEVLTAGDDLAAADEWKPVTLEGRYLADDEVYARNRPHGGTSAFEVLVPFRTDDGRTLLVDRGWVPPGDGEGPDAVPAPPSGEVAVVVRLRPGEPLPASGRSAPVGQVPTIHLPSVAAEVPGVETGAFGVLVSESPAPAAAPTALDAPSIDPGPYLSYAVQWILFAVMGFVFIGYVIRTERRHRRDEREAAAPGLTVAPAPPRRRDRDADAEDALADRLSPRG